MASSSDELFEDSVDSTLLETPMLSPGAEPFQPIQPDPPSSPLLESGATIPHCDTTAPNTTAVASSPSSASSSPLSESGATTPHRDTTAPTTTAVASSPSSGTLPSETPVAVDDTQASGSPKPSTPASHTPSEIPIAVRRIVSGLPQRANVYKDADYYDSKNGSMVIVWPLMQVLGNLSYMENEESLPEMAFCEDVFTQVRFTKKWDASCEEWQNDRCGLTSEFDIGEKAVALFLSYAIPRPEYYMVLRYESDPVDGILLEGEPYTIHDDYVEYGLHREEPSEEEKSAAPSASGTVLLNPRIF